jgi:magnesium chelatase family protein
MIVNDGDKSKIMISKVLSSAIPGVDSYLVEVEVDLAFVLQLNTVGLPEGAVREIKERVRAVIKNCDYEFPSRRITVNLAPADIIKVGSAFDLPISLGILSA